MRRAFDHHPGQPVDHPRAHRKSLAVEPRRRRIGLTGPVVFTRLFAGLAVVVAPSVVAPSQVRAASFDLDFFKPTTQSTGTITEENGLTVARGHLDVGVAGGYGYRPLVLEDQRAVMPPVDIVRDRATAFLVAAYGITERLDVGLRLAAVVRQVGVAKVEIAEDAGIPLRPRSPALGDSELFVRFALVHAHTPRRRFRLTLLAPLGIPTGAAEALAGNGKLTARPRLIAGWHWERLSLSFSAGYAYIPPAEVPQSGLIVGNAVLAGVGMAYAVVPGRAWVLAESSASVGLKTSATAAGSLTSQLLAGARVLLPGGLLAQGALGTGLSRGAGSPRFAATLGLARVWAFH